MTTATLFEKTPAEDLDYGIDWSDWLPSGDTIANSAWAADAGITTASAAFTDTATSIEASAGTAGNVYALTNTITTANGLVAVRTIEITVVEERTL